MAQSHFWFHSQTGLLFFMDRCDIPFLLSNLLLATLCKTRKQFYYLFHTLLVYLIHVHLYHCTPWSKQFLHAGFDCGRRPFSHFSQGCKLFMSMVAAVFRNDRCLIDVDLIDWSQFICFLFPSQGNSRDLGFSENHTYCVDKKSLPVNGAVHPNVTCCTQMSLPIQTSWTCSC